MIGTWSCQYPEKALSRERKLKKNKTKQKKNSEERDLGCQKKRNRTVGTGANNILTQSGNKDSEYIAFQPLESLDFCPEHHGAIWRSLNKGMS